MIPSPFKNVLTFLVLLFYIKFPDVSSQEFSYPNGKSVHIAGIFPRNGSAPAIATRMAVEDINKRANNTFHTITLAIGESGCDSKSAARLMYKIMSTGPQKSVIIAGCPEDCEVLGKASPVFNAITICYSGSSSEIPQYSSTETGVPSLFLAQPHPFAVNIVLVKFIRHFRWKRVALLNEEDKEFGFVADNLALTLEHHETEVERIEMSTSEDVRSSLEKLSSDIRIIVTLASEPLSRQILCQIYHRRLFDSKKYVLFFLGSLHKKWFLQTSPTSSITDDRDDPIHCTPEQMTQAAEGHFTMNAALWNPDKEIITVSGMTVGEFQSRLLREVRESGEHKNSDFDLSSLAYDSVWAAYFALNEMAASNCSDGESESPCQFAYDNYGFETQLAMIGNDFKFQGLSGQVSFNLNGERRIQDSYIEISRFQNNEQKIIAWHFNNFSWLETEPFGEDIPKDGPDIDEESAKPEIKTTEIPTLNCNSAAGRRIITAKYLIPILYLITSQCSS